MSFRGMVGSVEHLSLTMSMAESPLAPSPKIALNASLKSPVEIPLR